MSGAEQKRHLEGALLELNDSRLAFVPLVHGIVHAGQPDAKVLVKLGTAPSGV